MNRVTKRNKQKLLKWGVKNCIARKYAYRHFFNHLKLRGIDCNDNC